MLITHAIHGHCSQNGLKGRAVGATQEAHFISYCRLLSPREIAKLFGRHEMVGRGGGDRTDDPLAYASVLSLEDLTAYNIDYSGVDENPQVQCNS